jgi:hypothetical protein
VFVKTNKRKRLNLPNEGGGKHKDVLAPLERMDVLLYEKFAAKFAKPSFSSGEASRIAPKAELAFSWFRLPS